MKSFTLRTNTFTLNLIFIFFNLIFFRYYGLPKANTLLIHDLQRGLVAHTKRIHRRAEAARQAAVAATTGLVGGFAAALVAPLPRPPPRLPPPLAVSPPVVVAKIRYGILAMARRHGEVKGALRSARAALGAAEAKQRVDGAELEQLRGSWSDIEKAQEMIAYVEVNVIIITFSVATHMCTH